MSPQYTIPGTIVHCWVNLGLIVVPLRDTVVGQGGVLLMRHLIIIETSCRLACKAIIP